ncbi:MAG: extracellular solute-binding protein [Pigmentiphaga sp.]|uniref:ABC transporter substrate-binding protein n=1 Tax=Pigmentiphaga sp. TaxID=1977564 RepID=UPI0029A9146A|nr:extracellular solute-binding protein [Pigmentiphaga sp.]MDX3905925.1 extracellular solute-binding protein [Pigmentiphaga sp.]
MSRPSSTRFGGFLHAARRAALGGLMAVSLPALAQSTGDVEQPAALVKAAQAEGQLMIYSSSDENQTKTLLAAFEKRYGIKGSFIRFPTGPLMQRFSTEYDAKDVRADIVSVSSPVPYEQRPDRFADLGRSVLPNLAKWPDYRVADKHMIWTTDLVALAYNTEQLKPQEVPKTWTELADPKWKGKFLLTDPQVADNYMGWLDAIERARGVELLRKIAGQNYKITQSGASGAQMVAAGAYLFNAPTFASFSARLIEKKAPIAIQYLQDPAVVSPRSIAIVADAPHPNAARLYLNWLLSEEGLKLTCSISPTSLAMAPDDSRGCIPVRKGMEMRFDVPDERKRMLARELGVAR